MKDRRGYTGTACSSQQQVEGHKMIPYRRHKCALNICACLSGVDISGDDIGKRDAVVGTYIRA